MTNSNYSKQKDKEIRIPYFLHPKYNALKTNKERQEFVQRYKSWLSNSITEDLMSYLEHELQEEIKKEEKTVFGTLFQFKYSLYFSRGKRSLLRKLLSR